MPPAVSFASPVDALRTARRGRRRRCGHSWRHKRLAGLNVNVVVEGGTIKLRGVVPDAKIRRVIVSLAENTVGVEGVLDELAVPAG